jgi:hypothetical protein
MVVESSVVPAWLAALARRLAAAETVELEVFRLGERRAGPPKPLVLTLYERVDARIFSRRPDALDLVRIEARAVPAGNFDGRDVVLDFASSDPRELARGTRYGAWELTHGLTEPAGSVPLYRVQIDAHLEEATRVLYTSYGAVDPASPHRTRNQALWKAQGAYAHRLESVRRLGREYVESRPLTVVSTANDDADRFPTSRQVVSEAAGAALGVVGRRVRSIRRREAWFIAARPRRETPLTGQWSDSTEGFAPLEWLSQTAVADPFVLERGGDTYVFFEDEPGGEKAHISYVQLDADARPTSPPATVLAAPHHLSYPFVFCHDGEIFMIPESSADRTVALYRASPFPSTWIPEQVLLRDVRAYDATLLVDGARLWLFAVLAEQGAAPSDDLHLYSSEALSGPWEPHPANPVVSDVRSARPAGRIFRHDGYLVRPSQDCSRRYGYAIVFNRIDTLTGDEYAETPIGRIEPDWLPGLVATHTYNFGSLVEVIDGKRLVPWPQLDRFRAGRTARSGFV